MVQSYNNEQPSKQQQHCTGVALSFSTVPDMTAILVGPYRYYLSIFHGTFCGYDISGNMTMFLAQVTSAESI